jgi:hypothetical protein
MMKCCFFVVEISLVTTALMLAFAGAAVVSHNAPVTERTTQVEKVTVEIGSSAKLIED